MPKITVHLALALAMAGVSLGEAIPVNAQDSDVGEVTITDSRPEPITESEPLPIPGEGTAEQSPAGMADYAPYALANYGGQGSPPMPGGGTPIHDKHWYGYVNQGPWMRPIRRPLYRVPVQYARYWPSSYYTGGYSPAARYAQPLPMVYQPTDTTQLGFYHQRVPQWQPRPDAIPGPPWPPAWHYAIPVRYGTYRYPWGQRPGMDGYAGSGGWNNHGLGGPANDPNGIAGMPYGAAMPYATDMSGTMSEGGSQIIESSPATDGGTSGIIEAPNPLPTDAGN